MSRGPSTNQGRRAWRHRGMTARFRVRPYVGAVLLIDAAQQDPRLISAVRCRPVACNARADLALIPLNGQNAYGVLLGRPSADWCCAGVRGPAVPAVLAQEGGGHDEGLPPDGNWREKSRHPLGELNGDSRGETDTPGGLVAHRPAERPPAIWNGISFWLARRPQPPKVQTSPGRLVEYSRFHPRERTLARILADSAKRTSPAGPFPSRLDAATVCSAGGRSFLYAAGDWCWVAGPS